ncbi:hypothetical protein KAR91_71405 [Candidatus Pacearchaeota archaeon]|nr:hypothetical protein [Candidatus Pacearchaeota archaeon]
MGLTNLIPGATQAKLAIGVAVLVVIGLLGFQVWRLEGKVETQIETIQKQADVIDGLEDENIIKDVTFSLTKEKNEAVQEQKDLRAKDREAYENEINSSREERRNQAFNSPFLYGLRDAIDLGRIMCRFENADNAENRKTCDSGILDSNNLSVNHPIVFSSRTSKDYATMCEFDREQFNTKREAGKLEEDEEFYSDFCNWVVIGFTKDGWDNFQIWLNRAADRHIDLHDTLQNYQEAIDIVNNMDQIIQPE